ncbi:tetratricopeptide repeat protein [Ralstonia sp. UBA689]|uniref:tetratricopeptide repeat protein n=1 Tax=Ralstonia sp. UBA689 TaxID=1947373 RepID=UPI0025CC5B2B|nr:tetratricopeptide repeat protein [Ralstonia sp. UBA689]
MSHAFPRSSATQRSRRFPRSQAALLAALVAGGLASLPTWAANAVTAPALIAQAAQESGAGSRATAQFERSRPRGGLLNSERSDLPSVPLTGDIMYQVLAAEVSLQRGQPEPAYRVYLALAQDTRDPRFAQRATEIAFLTRSAPQALRASRVWVELSPTSMQARQVQQLLLVATGQWSEVEPMLQAQLNKISPGQRADAILQLQQQMSKSNDPAGAVTALQHIVAHDMQRPETHLALARAKVAAKDVRGALSELDTALKQRPGYEEAAILAAELRADDNPDAAIAGLRTFLKAAPASIDGHLALARMYLVRDQQDQARSEFEAVKKIAPNDARITLALGLLNLQQRQYDTAERYLKEYVSLTAKSPTLSPEPGYQGLAQLAEEKRDYAGALAWVDKITGSANGDADGQIALAAGIKRGQLLGKLRRIDEAQQAFDELVADAEDVPDGPRRQALMDGIRQAEIGMLMDAKAYGRARARVNELLKNDPDNVEYTYQLSMLEEHDGHYDNMETLLRKVIDLRPGQAIGYNALGYSLADRNVRLQEAQELLEKAVSLAPDDPYIADSLGWVKYRRGDLPAATDILKKAWAAAPQAEIGAHLGEVLWQSGKQDDARQIWTEAAKLDINDATLRETLRRFGQPIPDVPMSAN